MPIEVIIEVQATLERHLFNSQTVEQMIKVCVHAVFIICGFCAVLGGEELPMMSMDAMAKHYKKDQPVEGSLENVFRAFRGRVKGEHSEDAWQLIPIAATTETGLKPIFWIGQSVWKESPLVGRFETKLEHLGGSHITSFTSLV
jgi:hypothetical protein